jgi:hypothetical protein
MARASTTGYYGRAFMVGERRGGGGKEEGDLVEGEEEKKGPARGIFKIHLESSCADRKRQRSQRADVAGVARPASLMGNKVGKSRPGACASGEAAQCLSRGPS